MPEIKIDCETRCVHCQEDLHTKQEHSGILLVYQCTTCLAEDTDKAYDMGYEAAKNDIEISKEQMEATKQVLNTLA